MPSKHSSFLCWFFFALCFRFFHAFSLKSLPAAHKGRKRQKRGFSRVSSSEFKDVRANCLYAFTSRDVTSCFSLLNRPTRIKIGIENSVLKIYLQLF